MEIKIEHENLGTINKNCVTIRTEHGTINLYFSYKTLVAVNGLVSVNNWGTTTGKLLNELEPDKSKRVKHDEVLKKAQEELKSVLYSTPEQIQQNL